MVTRSLLPLGLLLAPAAANPPDPATVTLAEARAMAPSNLADRLLTDRPHGPMVDAIVNGRGLTPPSASVHRLWLVERMVPFDAQLCRSHVWELELAPLDATAKSLFAAVPTHVVTVEQYDRLWMPRDDVATAQSCARAPAQASGFSDGGLGLRQASAIVRQAREVFTSAPSRLRFRVKCRGERKACGSDARRTLATIDWSALGLVEQVSAEGEAYYFGDPKPADAAWGPAFVQFTFPYAADGATWVITVTRTPAITAVRMEAPMIAYD